MNTAGKQKRMTRQKQLIYNILCSTKTHPTADWIYETARLSMPGISLGTVYRNLQVLEEEGLIQELRYGKSHSHFDCNANLHYHFIYDDCGAVIDVENVDIINFSGMEEKLPGQLRTHRMEFYGVCHKCAANKQQQI